MFQNRLGGNEPLDYISLYNNAGDAKRNIPAHWHYISFGLSDLYGDCRVHRRSLNQELSGFGFELTFRLKKDQTETIPPMWPADILQSLAKYVFHTGNIICSGDHVSENKPLNNGNSIIQHMLMTDDPQLGTVFGPFGKVTFIQIVGVTNDELKASQQWNVKGMIDLMRKMPETGGDLLVTEMQRSKSIFEFKQEIKQAVEQGINQEGSNLSGVSAKCSFKCKIILDQLNSDEDNTSSIDDPSDYDEEEFDDEEQITSESEKSYSNNSLSDEEELNNKDEEANKLTQDKKEQKQLDSDEINRLEDDLSKITITKETVNPKSSIEQLTKLNENQSIKESTTLTINQNVNNDDSNKKIANSTATTNEPILSPRNIISPKSECSSSMSVSHENQNNNCNSSMSYTSETGNEHINFLEIKYFKEIHIFLNLEAGLLLPLVLKGRLKHNHHFTYKSTKLAITFLTPSVSGALVNKENPFGYYGSWLQILLDNNLVEKMIIDLENAEHKLHVSLFIF